MNAFLDIDIQVNKPKITLRRNVYGGHVGFPAVSEAPEKILKISHSPKLPLIPSIKCVKLPSIVNALP